MPSGSGSRPGWVEWLFADRETGRIVIAQFPNFPLWAAIVLFAARVVVGWFDPVATWLESGLDLGFVIAISWWAVLEIFSGVNPWRRFLGAAVLVFVVGSRLVG